MDAVYERTKLVLAEGRPLPILMSRLPELKRPIMSVVRVPIPDRAPMTDAQVQKLWDDLNEEHDRG